MNTTDVEIDDVFQLGLAPLTVKFVYGTLWSFMLFFSLGPAIASHEFNALWWNGTDVTSAIDSSLAGYKFFFLAFPGALICGIAGYLLSDKTQRKILPAIYEAGLFMAMAPIMGFCLCYIANGGA